MAKVYAPNGKELTLTEIGEWGRKVHIQSGGKDNPIFHDPNFWKDRLKGDMCRCGTDALGYSNGEFRLVPLNDEIVIEGCKAYMQCKICGSYSHL